MKIEINQLNTIKQALSDLSDFGIDYEDDSGYLNEEELEELPDEMEVEDVCLRFPDDQDYTLVDTEVFLSYMSEIATLRRVDDKTVRTQHYIQTKISSPRKGYSGFEERLKSYAFRGEDVEASIVEKPFLIGVMNAKENKYDEDFGLGACEPYTAIEFKIGDVVEEKYLEELIERICFYLTDKLGVEVYPWKGPDFSVLYDQLDEYYGDDIDEETEEDDRGEDNYCVEISSLPEYTPLLRMYRQAKGINDPEIQFLQYYKIIEYVSPIVARSVAYDHLNRRLDLLPAVRRDHAYLDSILAVAKKYDKDMRDDSLVQAVIETCADVLPLYEMLPQRLRKHVKATVKLQKDSLHDEDVTEEQVKLLQKQVASILYSTRNSIVHAKSNYEATGLEMDEAEMEEAKELMNTITRAIVNWNQRQPEWSRL